MKSGIKQKRINLVAQRKDKTSFQTLKEELRKKMVVIYDYYLSIQGIQGSIFFFSLAVLGPSCGMQDFFFFFLAVTSQLQHVGSGSLTRREPSPSVLQRSMESQPLDQGSIGFYFFSRFHFKAIWRQVLPKITLNMSQTLRHFL